MKRLLSILLLVFAFSYLGFAADVELDYFEYADDATAQAAYVSSDSSPTAKATGGTITYSGSYVIHTFTANGTFTPASGFDVEYLVVAGGGGGGAGGGTGAGGGGAGGYRTASGFAVTAQGYSIVVGAGGAAASTGVASSFSTISAAGGGYGATRSTINGGAGGSGGGGAAYANITPGAGNTPVTDPVQGYAGGAGLLNKVNAAGGGGGASEVGENGTDPTPSGSGGDGSASSINGSSVTRGGGGGGGAENGTAGSGGTGGGGAGGTNNAAGTAGTVNTGGGGGGGSLNAAGGAGGSGIVIIRYLGAVNLQSYSESTIKQQGSYSLKGVAVITDSLNDTLTRTVDPTIDLSDKTSIKYDIYSASRTGSQIKIGIHDSGGTTTEHTANISSTGAWEEQTWDISAVTNANKDVIDSIIITVVNADAANTFYFDLMYGTDEVVPAEHPTPAQVLIGGLWFKDGVLQYSDWPRLKRGTAE